MEKRPQKRERQTPRARARKNGAAQKEKWMEGGARADVRGTTAQPQAQTAHTILYSRTGTRDVFVHPSLRCHV